MSYIVWIDYYNEGWKPSDEQPTLDACFEWLNTNNYGNPYKITKTVQYEIKEIAYNDRTTQI